MDIHIFSHEVCELGEGPLWSPERTSLFWVDINRNTVFEKALSSQVSHYDHCWKLDKTPTALARVMGDANHLWVITEQGLLKLNLSNGQQKLAVPLLLPEGLRTNDAGIGPDGQLWTGSMQRKPLAAAGQLYSINDQMQATAHTQAIAIPNTFCWSPDGQFCYLTDSLQQTLYRVPFPAGMTNFNAYPWLRSQEEGVTYDGGAIDQQGNLWVARWGGYCLDQISPQGQLLNRITLPAQQPSSCCFGGTDLSLLFITTAIEGLSSAELATTPDAGKILVLTSSLPGLAIPSFRLQTKKTDYTGVL